MLSTRHVTKQLDLFEWGKDDKKIMVMGREGFL